MTVKAIQNASLIHPLLFNINKQQWWGNSVEHPNYNYELVRALSPEHTLIHQAFHTYKDMDFSKYNLVDSHEIIRIKKELNEAVVFDGRNLFEPVRMKAKGFDYWSIGRLG